MNTEYWERRGSAIYTEDAGPGTAKLIAELHGLENASKIADRIVEEHNNVVGKLRNEGE